MSRLSIWYVMTCSGTMHKKKQIDEIARFLGINNKVEIIK